MFNQIIIVALLAAVSCHDLKIGENNTGTKIYDARSQSSPAIWRQDQNVTINTNDTEVISKVIVTDMRPNKDGEVKLVDGGEGHKTVTLELMSPTALRGYDFQIEVYSEPERAQVNTPVQVGHDHQRVQRNPLDVSSTEESKTNRDSTTALPVEQNKESSVNLKEIRSTSTEKTHEAYLPRGLAKENVPVVSTTSADLPISPIIPIENQRDTRGAENDEKLIIPKPITTSKDYKPHDDQSELVKSTLTNHNDHLRYSRDTVSQNKAGDIETDTANVGNRPAQVFNPPVYPTTKPKENTPYSTHPPTTAQIPLTRNFEEKSVDVPRFHVGIPIQPNFNNKPEDPIHSSATEDTKKNDDKISTTTTAATSIKSNQETEVKLRDARETNDNSYSSSTTAAYRRSDIDPTPEPEEVKNVTEEHDIPQVPRKVYYDHPSVIPLHYNPQRTAESSINPSTSTETNQDATVKFGTKRDTAETAKSDLKENTPKINIPKRLGEPTVSTTDNPTIPKNRDSTGEQKPVIY